MERRLAAILVADLVGYSGVMEADESRALNVIRRLREELLEPEILANSGEIAKRLGDGWIAEFPSVLGAVNCAINVQNNTRSIDEIELRIGIHLGDIVHEEQEIYGDGVNIAARLESIGFPGGVLISDAVKREISGKVQDTFYDLGPVQLKNIMVPVHVWSWPEIPQHLKNTGVVGKKPKLFVQDFESRSDGTDDFVHSIKDDLMTAFGRQSGIAVVTEKEEADFNLEGSVRSANTQWRITARLVNCATNQTEWSDRFDESGENIFAIQDSCVMRIVGAVRIRLPVLLSRESDGSSLRDLSVEELLNYAMSCHFKPAPADWDQAVEALELALDRDKRNWMAMTMLSFNYTSRCRLFGWTKSEQLPSSTAREWIEKALAIKPDSEVVRLVHGVYLLYAERNPNSARTQVGESLRLNPDYYHSINVMSQIELNAGNLESAYDFAKKAADCDPGYPYLHLYLRDLGYVLMALGKYENAINKFERADMAAPGLPRNLIGMIACGYLAGNAEYAQKAYVKLLEVANDFKVGEYDPWPIPSLADWPELNDALESIEAN